MVILGNGIGMTTPTGLQPKFGMYRILDRINQKTYKTGGDTHPLDDSFITSEKEKSVLRDMLIRANTPVLKAMFMGLLPRDLTVTFEEKKNAFYMYSFHIQRSGQVLVRKLFAFYPFNADIARYPSLEQFPLLRQGAIEDLEEPTLQDTAFKNKICNPKLPKRLLSFQDNQGNRYHLIATGSHAETIKRLSQRKLFEKKVSAEAIYASIQQTSPNDD